MHDEPRRAPVDRVDTDLLCASCQYNLRTLPIGGVCPECAKPVQLSLQAQADRTQFAPINLFLGSACGLIALALMALCVFAAIGTRRLDAKTKQTGQFEPSYASAGWACCASFAALFFAAVGWASLARAQRVARYQSTARRLGRVFLAIIILAALAQLLIHTGVAWR